MRVANLKGGDDVRIAVFPWVSAVALAISEGDADGVMKFVRIARLKAEGLESKSLRERNVGWKRWLAGDCERRGLGPMTPSGNAFRWIKGLAGWTKSPIGTQGQNDAVPDEHDYLGDTSDCVDRPRCWTGRGCDTASAAPLCDQADVEQEADTWAKLWNELNAYDVLIDPAGSPMPAPIVTSAIRRGAMTFPAGTGLGGDNTSPRAINRLSDEVVHALSQLLMAMEAYGDWAAVFRLVLIVLLPKDDGGRRPIGLFPTVIRLWSRIRVQIAREWEAANPRGCIYGGTDMGAQRAAWQVAFRAENAALTNKQYAQTLLDLVKAFEKVPHHHVVAAARKHGYNLWVLRLSLASYRLPRSVGVNSVYSRTIIAVCGITAGSGSATTELRLLFLDVIDDTYRMWPSISMALYVDDLTIEGEDEDGTVVRAVVAGATDSVIHMLQVELEMEVSAKKSVAVAGRYKLAMSIAKVTRTLELKHARSTKLLGTPSGGGRRRSTHALAVRTTAFAKRVPRIQALRRAGVRTTQLVRAAGTPMLTYGVDIVGMSDSHLKTVRSQVARAAAAAAHGKSPDLVLYAADGAKGTMDPAFDAHVIPIRSWALAWWQHWQPPGFLEKAHNAAVIKVNNAKTSAWSVVAGPAAAVIVTARRIGWRFKSAGVMVTHDGTELDCKRDPPIVIARAAQEAVRRWRLDVISKAFPQLVPEDPDLVDVKADGICDAQERSAGGPTIPLDVVDFSDVIGKLVNGRTSTAKEFDEWRPQHAASLTSAFVGGQWPQTRLVGTRKWTDDLRCQLCLGADGTLLHRHDCPATVPSTGWQQPSAEAETILAALGERRRFLLIARGLFVMRVQVPKPPCDETFQWLVEPPENKLSGARWFIDGSMFDEPRRFARRIGFGIVVTSCDGTLLGYGNGTPPNWIHDAAGAEVWAFYKVASLNAFLPHTTTDCLGIVDTLASGVRAAVGEKKVLARLWGLIACCLNGDFGHAASMVVWMPAHGSKLSIGKAIKSDLTPVTSLEWRANRLVDGLAKAAAGANRVERRITKRVVEASALVQYAAAKVGVVTYAANNYKVDVTNAEGVTTNCTKRDAFAPRSNGAKRSAEHSNSSSVTKALPCPPTTTAIGQDIGHGVTVVCAAAVPKYGRKVSVDAAKLAHKHLEELQDAERVARWRASIVLRPASGPSASERMQALRERIKLKVAAAKH
jgi:hypothetical protein